MVGRSGPVRDQRDFPRHRLQSRKRNDPRGRPTEDLRLPPWSRTIRSTIQRAWPSSRYLESHDRDGVRCPSIRHGAWWNDHAMRQSQANAKRRDYCHRADGCRRGGRGYYLMNDRYRAPSLSRALRPCHPQMQMLSVGTSGKKNTQRPKWPPSVSLIVW